MEAEMEIEMGIGTGTEIGIEAGTGTEAGPCDIILVRLWADERLEGEAEEIKSSWIMLNSKSTASLDLMWYDKIK